MMEYFYTLSVLYCSKGSWNTLNKVINRINGNKAENLLSKCEVSNTQKRTERGSKPQFEDHVKSLKVPVLLE